MKEINSIRSSTVSGKALQRPVARAEAVASVSPAHFDQHLLASCPHVLPLQPDATSHGLLVDGAAGMVGSTRKWLSRMQIAGGEAVTTAGGKLPLSAQWVDMCDEQLSSAATTTTLRLCDLESFMGAIPSNAAAVVGGAGGAAQQAPAGGPIIMYPAIQDGSAPGSSNYAALNGRNGGGSGDNAFGPRFIVSSGSGGPPFNTGDAVNSLPCDWYSESALEVEPHAAAANALPSADACTAAATLQPPSFSQLFRALAQQEAPRGVLFGSDGGSNGGGSIWQQHCHQAVADVLMEGTEEGGGGGGDAAGSGNGSIAIKSEPPLPQPQPQQLMQHHDFVFDDLQFSKPSRMKPVYLAFSVSVARPPQLAAANNPCAQPPAELLLLTVWELPTVVICKKNKQFLKACECLGLPTSIGCELERVRAARLERVSMRSSSSQQGGQRAAGGTRRASSRHPGSGGSSSGKDKDSGSAEDCEDGAAAAASGDAPQPLGRSGVSFLLTAHSSSLHLAPRCAAVTAARSCGSGGATAAAAAATDRPPTRSAKRPRMAMTANPEDHGAIQDVDALMTDHGIDCNANVVLKDVDGSNGGGDSAAASGGCPTADGFGVALDCNGCSKALCSLTSSQAPLPAEVKRCNGSSSSCSSLPSLDAPPAAAAALVPSARTPPPRNQAAVAILQQKSPVQCGSAADAPPCGHPGVDHSPTAAVATAAAELSLPPWSSVADAGRWLHSRYEAQGYGRQLSEQSVAALLQYAHILSPESESGAEEASGGAVNRDLWTQVEGYLNRCLALMETVRGAWCRTGPLLICGFEVSRDKAAEMLSRHGPGAFVVRWSSNSEGGLVLSCRLSPEDATAAAAANQPLTGDIIHYFMAASDLAQRPLDVWLGSTAQATHLLDVNSGRLFEKQMVLGHKYTPIGAVVTAETDAAAAAERRRIRASRSAATQAAVRASGSAIPQMVAGADWPPLSDVACLAAAAPGRSGLLTARLPRGLTPQDADGSV